LLAGRSKSKLPWGEAARERAELLPPSHTDQQPEEAPKPGNLLVFLAGHRIQRRPSLRATQLQID